MPAPAITPGEAGKTSSFNELDKVKLIKAMTDKGRRFAPGIVGTIVYCHSTKAYEVEFPGIHDFFQIPPEYLEKA